MPSLAVLPVEKCRVSCDAVLQDDVSSDSEIWGFEAEAGSTYVPGDDGPGRPFEADLQVL